ncbi:MAG TPA: hypothetical protein VN345_20125, partial [Blastocatellia bacterium]|nr:hypothetical protein [Blastocatellia bacterium]
DGVSVVGGDNASGSPPTPKLSDLVQVCDLRDVKGSGGGITWAHSPVDKIAIDPLLGRIAFPTNSPPPQSVHTTYHYGFSAEMGGGEYGRIATFTTALDTILRVPGDPTNPTPEDRPTIQAALDDLAAGGGVVEINTNENFKETPVIRVPAAKTIELRAAEGFRPILALSGPMEITGGDESAVTINGLVINGGSITVTDKDGNSLQTLRLLHCTLVPGLTGPIGSPPEPPGAPRIVARLKNTKVLIESCITGPIQAVDGADVTIQNSIVDATDETEMAFGGLKGDDAGATLTLSNATVIGKVHTLMIELASNTIFLSSTKPFDALSGPVVADRLQQGCVRFSYIPSGSKVPRPHRCQPQDQNDAGRVRPILTSRKYGEAAYCQLSLRCALEIRGGADDQAEMGAFHNLCEPQREANLRARLDEYLRFGLEAGIFYAS